MPLTLAVSDTSPLSNLAVIGRLELLQSQFSKVWIPPAVERELSRLSNTDATSALEQAFRDGWLAQRALRDDRIVRLLTPPLHRGEAEAIALAVEIAADLILLDEHEARSVASRIGLHITGVLGVLLRAKQTGAIPSVRDEIVALRVRAGFFVSARLEQQVIELAGEA